MTRRWRWPDGSFTAIEHKGHGNGLEDREPLLADVEEVYGPGMAEVVRRYIDAPDLHPHEIHKEVYETAGDGPAIPQGSLPWSSSRNGRWWV